MLSYLRRREIFDLIFKLFTPDIEIRAWVILPNHYHLLTYIKDSNKLGNFFRLVHGSTARQWNLEEQISGRKVWYRYTDRAIRSQRHYYTTLNYLHYNPVKHNCVNSPYLWENSSVHWYLKHYGRQWLRDLWFEYPLLDYGKQWDYI